ARPGGTPCHTTRKSGTWGTPSLWHGVSPAASQPSQEVLGSSPISGCPLGAHSSASEAPSLHRHYPASSVLRASPPSAPARSDSHESPVGRPARPPRRVSRVALAIPLPRALVLTPVEPSPKIVRVLLDFGLPLARGGSASTTNVFGACSTFTAR